MRPSNNILTMLQTRFSLRRSWEWLPLPFMQSFLLQVLIGIWGVCKELKKGSVDLLERATVWHGSSLFFFSSHDSVSLLLLSFRQDQSINIIQQNKLLEIECLTVLPNSKLYPSHSSNFFHPANRSISESTNNQQKAAATMQPFCPPIGVKLATTFTAPSWSTP